MPYAQDAMLRSLAFTIALEYPQFAALTMREGSTVLDRLMADLADHRTHAGQFTFNRYVVGWLDNEYTTPGFIVTDGKGNSFPYTPDTNTHVMCDNWRHI